jgi:hypothetical protein
MAFDHAESRSFTLQKTIIRACNICGRTDASVTLGYERRDNYPDHPDRQ